MSPKGRKFALAASLNPVAEKRSRLMLLASRAYDMVHPSQFWQDLPVRQQERWCEMVAWLQGEAEA